MIWDDPLEPRSVAERLVRRELTPPPPVDDLLPTVPPPLWQMPSLAPPRTNGLSFMQGVEEPAFWGHLLPFQERMLHTMFGGTWTVASQEQAMRAMARRGRDAAARGYARTMAAVSGEPVDVIGRSETTRYHPDGKVTQINPPDPRTLRGIHPTLIEIDGIPYHREDRP